MIALEIKRLRNRMEQLRADPGTRLALLEPFVIPPNLKLPEWADSDGRLEGTTGELTLSGPSSAA